MIINTINSLDLHSDALDGNSAVAQRDQIAGALDGGNRGDARDGQHVAFCERVGADQAQGIRVRERDVADCDGGARGGGFGGYGD